MKDNAIIIMIITVIIKLITITITLIVKNNLSKIKEKQTNF